MTLVENYIALHQQRPSSYIIYQKTPVYIQRHRKDTDTMHVEKRRIECTSRPMLSSRSTTLVEKHIFLHIERPVYTKDT